MMKVEVRMPTYKRPALLRRALGSLISQSHSNWICIVLDDSPDQEGRLVCNSYDDSRIIYAPNEKNLGVCANIDQAFSKSPMKNSDFLCVLEDDNYYLSENLSDNIKIATTHGLDIVVRNQYIENMLVSGKDGELTKRTTYDGQYQDGVINNNALFASFFYSTGANNSSLFWRAKSGLDFSTLNYVDDPVIQERLRTLCIDRPVYIAMTPLIVWRDNGPESLRPKTRYSIYWRFNQVILGRRECEIYKNLFDYIKQLRFDDLIFSGPLSKFTAAHERVFHRVGIPVPSDKRRLSRSEVARIQLKRLLILLIGGFLSQPLGIAMSLDKRRLATAKGC